ncbi:MAG TPA: hypothetical protein VM240_10835 [Verrucomicrobiae bacterium]|nr:hypothetical protein [Verrucomicrobiae bacterium]
MKQFLSLAMGAATLLLAGQGTAQAPATTVAPGTVNPNSLVSLDSDRDGSISRAEAAGNSSLSSQFLTLDANGNGALESAEFSRFESTGTTGDTGGTMGAPAWPRNTITPPPPMTPTPVAPTVPSGTSPAPTGASPAPSGSTPPPGG